MNLPRHYKVLGVPPSATDKEIRDAYLAIARANNIDQQVGDAEKTKAATEAYAVLKNPVLRHLYDKQRKLLTIECVSCGGLGQVARYRRFQLIGYANCNTCEGTGEREI